MILDGRFPRLSPDGQHVACGALNVSIDGVVVGPGTTPIWLSATAIAYTRQPDGALMWRDHDGGGLHELQPAAHEPSSLCASKFGRMAWREKDGVHATNRREGVVLGAFRPTWASTDICWCLDTGTTADLYREGVLVARTVHDVRGMPDGRLCFIQVGAGGEQWTCVQHMNGRIDAWALAGAAEYQPLVLDLLGEEWVLSHTRDDRLLLRSGNNGIVLATGATFEPDAVVRADGTVRIVWADEKGRLVDRILTPLTKTTFGLSGEGMDPETRIVRDLRVKPQPTVAPWPPGPGWTRRDDIDEIDMVSFWLGNTWSRNGMHVAGDAVTYTHPFQSRAGLGYVQHAKFGPPDSRAATWTIANDGQWIGLAFDGTNELSAGYRFVNPGTDQTAAIYPRVMRVGIEHRRVVDLELLDLATGDRRRLQWAGWVEAVYDGPQIGDLPPSQHAVIMFEPDAGDSRGWRERNICIQGIGCWYWDRHRKTPGAVPDMRWIGTRNAPRFQDIPVQFSTYVPVAQDAEQPNPNPTPIPQPEPTPMPSTLPSYFALQHVSTGLYLAVEPSGTMVVDRPLAGLYETLTRRDGAHGGVALLSRHMGKFLRARDPGERDGDAPPDLAIAATGDTTSTYETFFPVPLSADTVALLTFHGGVWQRSDAGGLVGRLGPLDQHAWRVVPMPAPPAPTPEPGEPSDPDGPVTAVEPLVVDGAGRVLRTPSGAIYDYREASSFMLLARARGQNGGTLEDAVARAVHLRDRHRMNVLRVFATIGHPTFWQARGWKLFAGDPGLYDDMARLTQALVAQGIRPRWTLLADTDWTCPSASAQARHVQESAVALAPWVDQVLVELCNEPTMNGFGPEWASTLAGYALRIDQRFLIALGPEHGSTGHLKTADRSPADLVYFHPERVTSEAGWAWIRRLSEYGVVIDGERPVASGEPVNAGDEGAPGDYLRDPAIWFAYGALSRVVPQSGYMPTMHYDDGLWSDPPNDATSRCFDAFNAGCDALPIAAKRGQWVNGHWVEAPWRGFSQTDPPSDDKPSRIFGRIIGGEYLGVSIREPKGWTWSDLRYPVARVARSEGERFDCSVWKGRIQ